MKTNNKSRRVVRALGKGREAVRCVDGVWRVFELKTYADVYGHENVDVDSSGRRWVCVHVGTAPGKWPQEYFDRLKAAA